MSPDPASAPGPAGPSVTAIVPVFNEEATLAEVLRALAAAPSVDEILVVSDGSTDASVEIARRTGVRVIHHKRNAGKGLTLATGVEHARSPILLFVDGDILNLSRDLIEQLIRPVLAGRLAMNIGIRHRGILLDAIHRRTGPLLSGIRCLKREIFEAVPDEYLLGYRIETALNWACGELGEPCGTVVLRRIEHRVKEKKRGFRLGLAARLEMFAAVFRAWLRLRLDPPSLNHAGTRPASELELEYIDS